MKNSYWNSNGLHQEEVNHLNTLSPDMCFTDNKYMNAFIAISKLYYDVYNNGGGNILDTYYEDDDGYDTNDVQYHGIGEKCKQHINSVGVDVDLSELINDGQYLEAKVNEVVMLLQGEDLNYTKYTVWVNHNLKQIYSIETTADGFKPLVFGEESEMKSWLKSFTTESHLMYSLMS